MPRYQAVVNLDFTKQKSNGYQKIIAALLQCGWEYRETSALTLDTDDIARVWMGAEIIAKGSALAGTLSALTLHVQLIGRTKSYKAAANHKDALQQILDIEPPRAADDTDEGVGPK